MGSSNFGLTEEVLTLLPDRSSATGFLPDDVQTYIDIFKDRANKYLKGEHVKGYDLQQEPTEDGRVIVLVTQNVES
jgi:hypothetical protein